MNHKNISRPAAFIAAKQIIMNSKDATDIKRAEKAIDNYIYAICEKPLREERRLDLLYILRWKLTQMLEAGTLVMGGFEDPILNLHHQRLSSGK